MIPLMNTIVSFNSANFVQKIVKRQSPFPLTIEII